MGILLRQPPFKKKKSISYVNDSLWAYLDFTKGSGSQTSVEDKSGNANTGTLYNFAFDNINDGWINGGATLEGVDDYIQTANITYSNHNAITLELVLNLSRTKMYQGIFELSNANILRLMDFGADDIRFSLGATSNYISVPIPINQKVHLICEYDGSNLNAYINNVLVKSAASSSNLSGLAGQTLSLIFGKDTMSSNRFTQGTLYLARLYYKTLTSTEKTQNYNDAMGIK